ncbi:MAG: metallophosphoesterase, partial [Planctomycetota bacterium]|nr:metallophosphoesterase [Planctomycetota bacterium]
IVDARSLRLPDGNEPRVALSARLRHPSGQDVRVVCVHFDWVRDDGHRFGQAGAVARHLESLAEPYVLLGDLHDVRGSRTLELFESMADHVAREGAPTFPSDGPEKEIDFLLHSRPDPGRPGWTVKSVEVVPEAVASDHRPVRAVLRLAPEPARR